MSIIEPVSLIVVWAIIAVAALAHPDFSKFGAKLKCRSSKGTASFENEGIINIR